QSNVRGWRGRDGERAPGSRLDRSRCWSGRHDHQWSRDQIAWPSGRNRQGPHQSSQSYRLLAARLISPRLPSVRAARRETGDWLLGSAHRKALLMQQRSFIGPELDPPIAPTKTIDHRPTVSAKAGCPTGSNPELYHLFQLITAKPAMLDGRLFGGAH